MNVHLVQKPSAILRPVAQGSGATARPLPPPLPTLPALPISLVELILAHVPHVSTQPMPTYLFTLMALPPSVVPVAFQSIVHFANRSGTSMEDDTDLATVDPLLCVSRLARPSDMFSRLFEMVAPVLQLHAAASSGRDDTRKDDLIDRMLVGLCKSGNLKGLESLQERSIVDLSSRPIYKYMAAASEGGFVDVLDWWVSAVSTVEPTRHDRKRNGRPRHPNEGLQAAAMAGHWHVFQWWRTYEPQDMLRMDLRFLTMCRHGHVDLLSRASLCFRIYLDDDFPEYMDEASAAGHVEVLDWIMTHSESPGYTHKAMDEASRNGHLHVLDWWARSGLPLKFTSSAKVDAVRAGKTDVVNWWNSFPLYRTLLCSSLLPDSPAPSAIRSADLVMLASFGALPWIRAAIGDDILSVSHVLDTSAFYRAIARSGHVHIMDKYNSDLHDNEDVEPCLQLAAQYDHIQVWRYLIDEMYTGHHEDPDFSDLWKSCVHVAAEHGSLDILEVLMINIKTRPLASDFPSVVAAACKGGSIKALQFLIDNKYWTAGSLSQDDMQAALRAAAAHGRIEVLQWWYSKSQQQVSAFLVFSRVWVDMLAGAACRHMHVAALDWFVSTFGKLSFSIQSRHLQAVGIEHGGNNKPVVEWLLNASADGSIYLSAASQAYLKMALDRL